MEFLTVDERIELEKIKHHSTSDWQFKTADWTLDTSIYVSAPSSLKWTNYNTQALLKQSVAGGPIPEGRIVTWYRFGNGAQTFVQWGAPFIFRNQTTDGGSWVYQYYDISLFGSASGAGKPQDRASAGRVTSSSARTDLGTKTISLSLNPNTWYKLRATWWVSSGVFMIRLEYFDGTDWVQMCDDWADNTNSWATSSINRVGVGGVYTATPISSWFDDTEIWKRST
jgi:hypothetical protein